MYKYSVHTSLPTRISHLLEPLWWGRIGEGRNRLDKRTRDPVLPGRVRPTLGLSIAEPCAGPVLSNPCALPVVFSCEKQTQGRPSLSGVHVGTLDERPAGNEHLK